MAGETFVGIAYRGIELSRRARLVAAESGKARLHFNAPMPVGSEIAIVTDGGPEIRLQVLDVQEQVAGADTAPGMTVVPSELTGEPGDWWRDHIGDVELQIASDDAANDDAADSDSSDASSSDDDVAASDSDGEDGDANAEQVSEQASGQSDETDDA